MTKQKLVVVSNRLPVAVTKEDGELKFKASPGGLATALSSLKNEDLDMVWIGWPYIESDELTAADKSVITKKLRKDYDCVPVFLSREQVQKFYYGYANDTLWPLFHYFQSYAQYDNGYWNSYKEVNQQFKKVVLKHSDKNSSVWVHDYHLMLLPSFLRSSMPELTIGFFLHIPFPSFEIFRFLPHRKELLEGLLGSDLVGFHTYDYARHFLSSALRVLGLPSRHGSLTVEDRIVRADAFPIGIDYNKFADAATKDPVVQELIDELDELYKGQKVIISMDRLDYSKGIIKRLEAFEQFLENNHSWRKKIVMAMVAVPSRTEVDAYQKLRDEIERAVSRINGAYGSADWTPISYMFKNLPFEQIVAFLTRADIALLTPLRDGMNLVAKEFVASKQKRDGVLILSEMTGAVDEMPEATVINPNNIDAIEQAIKGALKVPKKVQRSRLKSMQKRLSKYTVKRWANDFVEQLNLTRDEHFLNGDKLLNLDRREKITRQYEKANKRLILADYDGTLRGFVSSHRLSHAAPPKKLLEIINKLARQKNTEVCILSGRPRQKLEEWFKDIPVSLAAEHGAWVNIGGEWAQQPISMHDNKADIIELLEQYTDRTPGAKIEIKDFAVVWHYRNVPVELAHARNANLTYELNRLIAGTDLKLHRGNKVIEIKPSTANKGYVAEELIAINEPDFVLALGDDYTDEDMFKVLPDEAFSVKVGLGDTDARYRVISIDKIHDLLNKLAETG